MTQSDTMLFTEAEVTKRINELATEIIQRHNATKPLFVCLLRGGAPFASKLMFAIAAQDPSFHPELDYITVKTYGDKRVDRPPELIFDLAPNTKPQGRTVILLDDVLDKGGTADFADRYMREQHGAAAVELVVLVQKEVERTVYPQATLWGFEAPSQWLTGMGMDDARITREANRWNGAISLAE